MHWRVRETVYDIPDDDIIGGDMQDIFAESPRIMAPMPEINCDEEPAAIEIDSKQKATLDAIEEQSVIVDEQTTLTMMNSVHIRKQHDDQ